ncbi:YlxR family protein [Mycoplasmopsis hyopharyngis]|uniref:YlxR family protein n=1 Tax=Mycoplasmopsis hyopharyngis TaxID=29558 RepID=UPI003872C0EF
MATEIKKNYNFTRKCIATNQITDIKNLIRFNLSKVQKKVTLDLKRTKKGRGAYFIPTVENWEKIVKTKSLNRVFRLNVDKKNYEKIQKELEDKKCLKKIE